MENLSVIPELGSSCEQSSHIVHLTVISAELKYYGTYYVCFSFGPQLFRTNVSDLGKNPYWNSEHKILLEDGPELLWISVFESDTLRDDTPVGYCAISLHSFTSSHREFEPEVFALSDPASSKNDTSGSITLSCFYADRVEAEKQYASTILSIVDQDGDEVLSFPEFKMLDNTFGNQMQSLTIEESFRAADKNKDGFLNVDELHSLLTTQSKELQLISYCPVCGDELGDPDWLLNMIHLNLCLGEGSGNDILTGGFLTEEHTSKEWMFKLSEWYHLSSYDTSLRSGSSASHILVYDRMKNKYIKEIIDEKVVLSIRATYGSKVGVRLMELGAKEILRSISEKQAIKMNSVDSAKDLVEFIDFFGNHIDMGEVGYHPDNMMHFDGFFRRTLKRDARPIANAKEDSIAVSAADGRVTAFEGVTDKKRFWIKGRKFSLRGLFGELCPDDFYGGVLLIFRLAPQLYEQDSHPFYAPVSGTIWDIIEVPGSLYSVNPSAVSSKYCNVFTENKHVVSIISTEVFGKVAVIAMGAPMVGSVNFTERSGANVLKGDQLGYFSFGVSTVICVFRKGSIVIDEDLLKNSSQSLETLVRVGMRVGKGSQCGLQRSKSFPMVSYSQVYVADIMNAQT